MTPHRVVWFRHRHRRAGLSRFEAVLIGAGVVLVMLQVWESLK